MSNPDSKLQAVDGYPAPADPPKRTARLAALPGILPPDLFALKAMAEPAVQEGPRAEQVPAQAHQRTASLHYGDLLPGRRKIIPA